MKHRLSLLGDFLMLQFLGICGGVFCGFVVSLFNAAVVDSYFRSNKFSLVGDRQFQIFESVRVWSFQICVLAGVLAGALCFQRLCLKKKPRES